MVCGHGKVSPGFSADRPCRRQKNARFPDSSVFFVSAVSRPRIPPVQSVRNVSSLSRPDELPMPGGSRLWTGARPFRARLFRFRLPFCPPFLHKNLFDNRGRYGADSPFAVGRRRPDFRTSLSSRVCRIERPRIFPHAERTERLFPFPAPTNAPCRAVFQAGCGQALPLPSPFLPPLLHNNNLLRQPGQIRSGCSVPCVCAGRSMPMAASSDLFRTQPSAHSFHQSVKRNVMTDSGCAFSPESRTARTLLPCRACGLYGA